MELFFAYAHYVAIFALASVLVSELVLLLLTPSESGVRMLSAVDLWYGILSVVVIGTGIARVFIVPESAAYYGGLTAFWIKMSLFAAVGILSIPPSIRFARWKKVFKLGQGLPTAQAIGSTRLIVVAELIILAFIPLSAVFVARG